VVAAEATSTVIIGRRRTCGSGPKKLLGKDETARGRVLRSCSGVVPTDRRDGPRKGPPFFYGTGKVELAKRDSANVR
jgi:hypothetical protein